MSFYNPIDVQIGIFEEKYRRTNSFPFQFKERVIVSLKLSEISKI
jgi:hypothetical protein